MRFSLRLLLAGLTLSLLVPETFGTRRLHAMPPPLPGELSTYEQDGSLARRRAFAHAMGNHRIDQGRLADANRRLRKLASNAGVKVPQTKDEARTPPGAWAGMPAKGNVRILILCIDFSDFPHEESQNSVAQVANRVFGNGSNGGPAPFESLANFYARSSYGQLTLNGNVLGWYRPSYTRASIPQTDAGRQSLISEVLLHYETLGHDFSQYDNNGDGVIDYIAVIWSGPDNGWANFWWGYQTDWNNDLTSLTLDGKRLGKYTWQWETKSGYTWSYPNFDPRVLIHETGHALGLPDYYDYDDRFGPAGGVGGLDQMDANKGDHNCFSKFLLDWITPTVVTTATPNLQLRSSGDHGDALIVMNQDPGGCFGEYFMVQNRNRVANDLNAGYPMDGLLIWHVDSRLNSTGRDYLFDNSYTDHKLLRLMEADGWEQIELGRPADSGDYYVSGKVFSPTSKPNSSRYDNAVTAMGIGNISSSVTTMSLDVTQVRDNTPPTGRPGKPSCNAYADWLYIGWDSRQVADTDSAIAGFRVQVGTALGGSDVFDGYAGTNTSMTLHDLGEWDGKTLFARVAAVNSAGLPGTWSYPSYGDTINLSPFYQGVLEDLTCSFKALGSWEADTTTSYAGGSSARVGGIGDRGRTYLQTHVTGPGTLSFHWKVSSESNDDFLTFTMDGALPPQITPISGSVDWAPRTLQVPSGRHLLRWAYAKGNAGRAGDDAAWVDNVVWNTIPRATAEVHPVAYATVPGGRISYYAAVENQLSNNKVEWTIGDSNGTFSNLQTANLASTVLTAGEALGIFTITATPLETPNTPGSATVTVVDPDTLTVINTPTCSSVPFGGSVSFLGSVEGISDTSVTYSILSGGGSITNGYYTAPSSGTSAITQATIRATSVSAPTRYQDATITLYDGPALTLVLDPAAVTLLPGATQRFTVSGDLGAGVNWSAWYPATISDAGLLTLPDATPMADCRYTITVTSRLDGLRTGSATATVKSMDLNEDAALDLRDILFLAKEWGKDASSKANLKGTGTVDQSDLDALMPRVIAAP